VCASNVAKRKRLLMLEVKRCVPEEVRSCCLLPSQYITISA